MAAISFQQNIVRVVHLEVVQGGPLNTLIPNTCLQQPMSGKPGLPPNEVSEGTMKRAPYVCVSVRPSKSMKMLLLCHFLADFDSVCFI